MKSNMTRKNMLWILAVLFSPAVFTSCLNSDEETIVLETPQNDTGIPDDSQAESNPFVGIGTTNVPNIQTSVDYVNGIPIIRIDMTGVKNTDNIEWLRLYGTGSSEQNIWVEVDNVPKGIDVYNNSDQADGRTIMTDVVFAVDNSGSMSEEADAIARDIISWSQQLASSGIDSRYGVVGYDGGVNGAIDLTMVNELSSFLNERTGTSRTSHFGGVNANSLSSMANSYPRTGGECGALAIEYADQYFSFRQGANRVYVNFTDEPNQPKSMEKYSVTFFSNQTNWPSSKGTVHTVYSDTKFSGNTWNTREQPWLISDYTGGTTIFTNSSFTGVTLASLPVTGAMENSYIIRFTNIAELLDGQQHKVHITIRSKDGSVTADKIFYIIFGVA
jgi:hypothetical protein